MTSPEQLHRRGTAASARGRHADARRLFNEAARGLPQGDLLARINASTAYLDAETGDPESAFARLADALRFDGLTSGTRGVLHSQLALLRMLRGEHDDALLHFGQAVPLLDDPVLLARVHLNRAMLHLQRQSPGEARGDLERAAAAYERGGDHYGVAKARHNLGYAHLLQGDLVASIREMDAAYPVLSVSTVMKATVEQDRAEALIAAGLHAEGRAALRGASGAYARRRLHRPRGEAELTLARSLTEVDPASAIAAARTAARLFARAEAPALRTRAEAAVLAAEVALGRTSRRLLTDADRISDVLDEQGLRWPSSTTRLLGARVAMRRGDLADARRRAAGVRVARAPLDVRLLAADVRAELAAAERRRATAFLHLRKGLEDLHTWQSSFGSLDLQTNVAGHGVSLGRRGLELAVESRRAETLFEWSERARMLVSRVQPVRAPQSPEIVAGLAELRGDVSPAREAELRARIRELAWRHDGSGAVMDPVPLTDLQEQLDEETALIAYVVASDRITGLVVTNSGTAWRDLGSRTAVDAMLGGLLPDLDMAASDLPGPLGPVVRGGLADRLEVLAAVLVAPLATDLGDRGVVLTPSGVLAGVPWTLLPGLAGRPITVAQSATSWLARRVTPLRTATAGFVAGPRVARAEDEVTAAAKEWPDAEVLSNSSATADAVSALAAKVDVLHVAAHGQHSAENPLFSGLQLHDGLWFGYDIDQLSAVPDVVLLSACEVGRSTVRWGEELIGMATAWLHAGARCVIASAAAVADEAAYDALVGVHRGLANGLAPAAALAAAVPPATADRPPVPFVCFG